MSDHAPRLGVFERYLSLWVAACMVAGVALGLIRLMIYPMMLRVDFSSVLRVGQRPRGLVITLVVNWLVKPFSMAFLGWLFFKNLFLPYVGPELASQHIAGVIILAAAPCTAMVFVWSHLSRGHPAYTLVQVFSQRPDHAGGVRADREVPGLRRREPGGAVPGIALRGAHLRRVVHRPLPGVLLAGHDPVYFNSPLTYGLMRLFRVPYPVAAPGALIGASNFFELAVATAIALYEPGSGAALATVVGVLVDVPVMPSVCRPCLATRHWFGEGAVSPTP